MAIIKTQNGWAIEFNQNEYAGFGGDCKQEYFCILHSLLNTITAAAENEEKPDEPNYHTIELLRAMLPSWEQVVQLNNEQLTVKS